MATQSAAQKQARILARFYAKRVASLFKNTTLMGINVSLSKKEIAHIEEEMMRCMQDWHAWFVIYGERR